MPLFNHPSFYKLQNQPRFEREKTRHQDFKAECPDEKLSQRAGCAFCSGLWQRIGTHAGHEFFTCNNLYKNKDNPLVLATFMLDDFSLVGEIAIRQKPAHERISFMMNNAKNILAKTNAKVEIGSLDFSWCVDKRTHVP